MILLPPSITSHPEPSRCRLLRVGLALTFTPPTLANPATRTANPPGAPNGGLCWVPDTPRWGKLRQGPGLLCRAAGAGGMRWDFVPAVGWPAPLHIPARESGREAQPTALSQDPGTARHSTPGEGPRRASPPEPYKGRRFTISRHFPESQRPWERGGRRRLRRSCGGRRSRPRLAPAGRCRPRGSGGRHTGVTAFPGHGGTHPRG